MGAGIAVGFRERYPAMFDEYRRRCKAPPPEFGLGDVFLWRESDQPAVFNLGTQPRPGRGATYPVVEQALRETRSIADRVGITTIAIPRIAAGYGGLSWKKGRAIVKAVFDDWQGMLFVNEEYEAGV
jgi:O-acetyl-ADP-ribose deacetylase (regulator of RNase III)